MSFYVFAWIASIFYALEAISGKLISKYTVSNPWLFNFVWSFLGLIMIAIAAAYNHVQMPHHLGLLLAAAVFYSIGGLLYILGIYFYDISVITPLYNFRTVFAVLLSALILKEVLSFEQYILIVVIFLASMFVTIDESFSFKSFFSWPILIILGDMLGLAFMGIFIKKSMAVDSYWSVTLGLALIAQIFFLFTLPLFWKDIKNLTLRKTSGIFVMALLGLVATLASNYAYTSNVGITSTIISLPLSMILAFVLSVFAPKLLEKHSNKVYLIRFSAAAIMLIAALKLSR